MAPATWSFAIPTASGTDAPRARWAVMAAERTHPVPCTGGPALEPLRPMRSPSNSRNDVPSYRTSTGFVSRWPPLTRTHSAPSPWRIRAASRIWPGSRISRPASAAASSRLGVTTRASGKSSATRAAWASTARSRVPLVETSTGSMTSWWRPQEPTAAATSRIVAAETSMPVLAAATTTSAQTWRICSPTKAAATSWMPEMPRGFWEDTAVTALVPWTPRARKHARSAWMPAPPPESDPAIVRATGGFSFIRRLEGAWTTRSGPQVVPSCCGERPRGAVNDQHPASSLLRYLPDQVHPGAGGGLHLGRRPLRPLGHDREAQFVVLPAAEGQLQRIEVGRQPSRIDQWQACGVHGRPDPRGVAEVAEVGREAVRDVDHGVGQEAAEDLDLPHPGHGAKVRRPEGGRNGLARLHQAEASRSSSEAPRHADHVARAGATALDDPAAGRIAEECHRDDELVTARDVPSDHRHPKGVAALPHAGIESLQEVHLDPRAHPQGHQRP